MSFVNEWFKHFSKFEFMPLCSYDVWISMDWLTTHPTILDYYNKTYTCTHEEGNTIIVKGIHRPIYLRHRYNLTIKEVF